MSKKRYTLDELAALERDEPMEFSFRDGYARDYYRRRFGKLEDDDKETILKDIVCEVGRTGAITPVAILDPIRVAGSTISKTTLPNEDFIKEKGLIS